MKRILLPFIFICASFTCNGMSDREKFETLNQKCRRNSTITTKQVIDALSDNQYLQDNPSAIINLAQHVKTYEYSFLIRYANKVMDRIDKGDVTIRKIDRHKAKLMIMEFAHHYSDEESKKLLPELNDITTALDKLESASKFIPRRGTSSDSFILSPLLQKVGFAAGLIIAGLLTKYAYTRITRPEKTN